MVWLVVISAIGALGGWVTSIIQVIEMKILIKNQAQTNYILSHPGEMVINGITGLVDELNRDPQKAKQFTGLVKRMGFDAWTRIKDEVNFDEKLNAFLSRLRNNPELQREVFDFVTACGIVAAKAGNAAVKEEVSKTIEQTIDREIPIPKKYRWLKPIIDKATSNGTGQGRPTEKQSKPGKSGLLPLE